MFRKFKYQLSKIISNKKLKLIFLFLFALGSLFDASPANALFGIGDVGIFDIAQVQLDALDFVDNTILQYVVFLMVLIAESAIFSGLSASLLQWAIDLPINLGSEIVVTGWNFIAGISNAFLVLVLVFIALTYILKIETFEGKKALPKFILIALLINFSKVFVSVFVDVAEILQNTISGALGGDFVTLAMAPLAESSMNLLLWLVGIIAAYAGAALIPYVNIAALGILVILFISGVLLEVISKVILLIIFNFAAGTIFLFFAGLFLMRIAMIWILTIFAPLAFVSSVLKTTKKHWDKWLRMLTEWSFLGIVVLFLLGLGLKLFGVIISPPTPFAFSALGGTFVLPRFIYYYLFLLVYLGVVFKLSKENMPEFADALIGQAKTLTGKALKIKQVRKIITGRPTEAIVKADAWLQRRPRAIQALTRPFTQPASTALLRHRSRVREEETKISKEFDEMNPEDQARYIQAQTTAQRRVALAAKMGGKFDTVDEELKKKVKKDAESIVDEKDYQKHVQDLTKALPSMMTDKIYIGLAIDKDKASKDVKEMVEEIKTQLSVDDLALEIALHYKEITKEDIKRDKAKALKTAQTYIGKNPNAPDKFLRDTAAATIHLRKASPADIEKIDNPSSPAVRFGSHGWSHKGWQKFTEKFGSEAINDLMDGPGGINNTVKDEPSFKKFCQKNPRSARFLLFNRAGQQLGWKGEGFAKEAGMEKKDEFEKRIRAEKRLPTPPVIPASMPIEEGRIRRRAQKIYGKREAGSEGYEHDKINEMLRGLGIEPGSDESSLYMEKRDWSEATEQLIKEERELMEAPTPLPKIIKGGTQEQQDVKKAITEGKDFIKKIKDNIKELQTLSQEVRSTRIEGLTEAQKDVLTEQKERIQNLKTEILTNKTELNTTINEIRNINKEIDEQIRESARQAAKQIQEEREEE